MSSLSKILLFFMLVICAAVATVRGADVTAIQQLNARREPIVPGAIYVLENEKLISILELLKEVPLNEMGTWIKRQDIETGSVQIGSYCSQYCYCRRWYYSLQSIQLTEGMRRTERIGDPFGCLEILNRPTTGLVYNREAEIRMNQWRETVFENMRRAARSKSAKIVLCSETTWAIKPSLLVAGTSDEQQAVTASRSVLDAIGLTCGEAKKTTKGIEIQVDVDEILLEARFRELSSVLATTQPQLQFAYSDEIVLGSGGKIALTNGSKTAAGR